MSYVLFRNCCDEGAYFYRPCPRCFVKRVSNTIALMVDNSECAMVRMPGTLALTQAKVELIERTWVKEENKNAGDRVCLHTCRVGCVVISKEAYRERENGVQSP